MSSFWLFIPINSPNPKDIQWSNSVFSQVLMFPLKHRTHIEDIRSINVGGINTPVGCTSPLRVKWVIKVILSCHQLLRSSLIFHHIAKRCRCSICYRLRDSEPVLDNLTEQKRGGRGVRVNSSGVRAEWRWVQQKKSRAEQKGSSEATTHPKYKRWEWDSALASRR